MSKKPDWQRKKIKDISSDVFAGATPSTKIAEYWENGNIPWMSSGEINDELVVETNKFITKSGFDNSSTKMVPKNSVLMALAGQGKTRGKVAINKIELCTNQSLAAIVPGNLVYYKYLYYLLSSRYDELRMLSSGEGSRGGLNLRIINNLYIEFPKYEIQKKISEILYLWDKGISLHENLIEKYRVMMNSVIQEVLLFEIETKPIRNYIIETGIKSTGKEIVHSVSVHKGVVDQIEHLGRVYAAKDTSNYNVVRYGDIIYTKSPTGEFPFGIVKQSHVLNNVIVSPLYGVYESKSYNMGVYIQAYFDSPIRTINFLKPIVQKGAKNTINITNKKFLEGIIPMPKNIEIINKTAAVLESLKLLINKEEEFVDMLKEQKRGLMQQLLTGKTRIS